MPGAEPTIDITQPLHLVRERWLEYVERRYLEELLAAHGGNVSVAASRRCRSRAPAPAAREVGLR